MNALGPLFSAFTDESRLEREFQDFHTENPHVYALLVSMAREWKAAGRGHLGIATLFEAARYNTGLRTASADEWKLNNNHRSRYARLIMSRERDLDGVFETRGLRS